MVVKEISADAKSYLRLPNQFTCPSELLKTPDAVGLYALVQSLLLWQQRKGFQIGSGGLRRWCRRFCADGDIRFGRAWKQLANAGLLKGHKYSYEQDRFQVVYTLLDTPDTTTPSIKQLYKSEVQKFLDLRIAAPDPKNDYLRVPTSVINDPQLSLAEKGLYISILQSLKIEKNVGEEFLRQNALRFSRVGEGVFRRLWNGLKDAGYLHQGRTFYARSGRFCWHYALTAEPSWVVMPMGISQAVAPTVAHVAKDEVERNTVMDQLRRNIRLQDLNQPKDARIALFVEEILHTMHKVVCERRRWIFVSGKPVETSNAAASMMALRTSDIDEVIERTLGYLCSDRYTVRNREAYLITVLLEQAQNGPLKRIERHAG